jgi:hypothetical protein
MIWVMPALTNPRIKLASYGVTSDIKVDDQPNIHFENATKYRIPNQLLVGVEKLYLY